MIKVLTKTESLISLELIVETFCSLFVQALRDKKYSFQTFTN